MRTIRITRVGQLGLTAEEVLGYRDGPDGPETVRLPSFRCGPTLTRIRPLEGRPRPNLRPLDRDDTCNWFTFDRIRLPYNLAHALLGMIQAGPGEYIQLQMEEKE